MIAGNVSSNVIDERRYCEKLHKLKTNPQGKPAAIESQGPSGF